MFLSFDDSEYNILLKLMFGTQNCETEIPPINNLTYSLLNLIFTSTFKLFVSNCIKGLFNCSNMDISLFSIVNLKK